MADDIPTSPSTSTTATYPAPAPHADTQALPPPRSVLITGASSGIGAATALRLDSEGMRVFAGVRDLEDGRVLAAQSSAGLVPVLLDVTDDASVSAAAATVGQAVGDDGLWGVVNNAGDAYPLPLELVDLADFRDQLEVNLVGQLRVTQAMLPLVRRAEGRFVFVGSIGGKVAIEFAGPYHASKYAVEALADVLRQELAPDSIAVTVIEPGPVKTQLWNKGLDRLDDLLASDRPAVEHYRERLESFRRTLRITEASGSTPESVAEVIHEALTVDRPRTHYPVGLQARVLDVVRPWVPDRLFDAVIHRFVG